MTWEYLFVELPHTNKTRLKVADLNVDVVPQIGAILTAYGAEGWEVVTFSQSFTGVGAHFPPKFLLRRAKP
jgi:hypothetical protein